MTTYCLTTGVLYGEGTIQQPGCEWAEKGPDPTDTCAAFFEEGTEISLKANPSTGWEVSEWQSSVPGVFTTATNGTTVTMIMPSSNVTVTVSFAHPEVNLTLQVGGGEGCIELLSPSGYVVSCAGGTILVPAEEVRVLATPSSGWQVQNWFLDGVSQGSTSTFLDFTLEGYTSRTVVVYFEELPACTTNYLDVDIVGMGSVSPPSGNYCDYLTLSLNPVPAIGYFFKEWQYDPLSGITESGILLIVEISANRSVTAVFEPYPDYISPVSTLFYCPSETYKDNVVSFDFTNNTDNPSVNEAFHFRVNFYADSLKRRLIYSSFSLADNKRWFYNDSAFHQMPSDGVIVDYQQSINVVYDPEILPQQSTDNQKEHRINNKNVSEIPLICGTQYYVDIEAYSVGTNNITFIKTISLLLDCEDIDSYKWSYNKDANNWLCSGQGKADLKIAGSHNQSLMPKVASNIFGMFQIIWQSRRGNTNPIYGAIWDSEQDVLYSSGQGFYDILQLENGNNPFIIADQAANFYITANLVDTIWYKTYIFPVYFEGQPVESTIVSFEKFCYPGLTTYLGSTYDQIKVRIYNEDINGSIVVNRDKVLPVVSKRSIRLDVDGISGAYAVRVRNIDDSDWGDWINIGSDLYYSTTDLPTADDISYDAYRIDNSRFIVPWNISRTNGIRRICCQVLTLYGISVVFCLEVFVNIDTIQHVYKFYSDSSYATEFPTYNGQYVLSLEKDTDGTTKSDSTIVYFKVIFNEPIYKDESTTPPTAYSNNEIKFNVSQQGINDIWDRGLTIESDNKTLKGLFTIYEEDGVFNKDGVGFIELIFPESVRTGACLSDSTDPYNLVISDEDAVKNIDLTPEEVYERYKTDRVSKVLEMNKFKQYYDKDDDNFKFGNPAYFKD